MQFKRLLGFSLIIVCTCLLVACNTASVKAIELMGAGDRIHDTYTFDNVGTKIKDDGKNTYTIYGSVDRLADENIKSEFEIAEDITHIVAIKLSAINEKVVKDEVEIYVNGARNYDAEHLNGSTYTFVLIEAKAASVVTISVKWNKNASVANYILNFDENLELK